MNQKWVLVSSQKKFSAGFDLGVKNINSVCDFPNNQIFGGSVF